jgi:tetratricopeptide (TPR) repeat protein
MLELGRGNPRPGGGGPVELRHGVSLGRRCADLPGRRPVPAGKISRKPGPAGSARSRWRRAPRGKNSWATRPGVSGSFPEAVEHYTRALALDPENFSARCNRGLARQASGDSAGALEDYDAAIARIAPLRPRLQTAAVCSTSSGATSTRALEDFEEGRESNEFYPEAHNNLGHTHVRRHDVDLGIREFGIALELRPTYVEARFNRGIAHLLKGDLDLAIGRSGKAAALDPRDPDCLYHLALAKRSKGDGAGALRDLQRAVNVAGRGLDQAGAGAESAPGVGRRSRLLRGFRRDGRQRGEEEIVQPDAAAESTPAPRRPVGKIQAETGPCPPKRRASTTNRTQTHFFSAAGHVQREYFASGDMSGKARARDRNLKGAGCPVYREVLGPDPEPEQVARAPV